jgi:hypothetical protein
MTILLSWLRLELRRRWRSLAVLTLLVAVSGAVVMTSVAAARRGASALTRLQQQTLPATTVVLPNTPNFDWGPIERLPEVAGLSRFVVDYEFSLDGIDPDGVGFPPADDALGRTLERPVVFDGRMFDPGAPDEAVVTRKFVRTYHKGVGDTITLHLPTAAQLDGSSTGAELKHYDGPAIAVRIVGVVASPWVSDSPDSPGGIQISSGLAERYSRLVVGDLSKPDNLQFVNALVRLKNGGADIEKLRTDVERLTGRSDIDVWDLPAQYRDVQHHIAFESRCLLAFGGAALIAALFLVGQAIVRYAAASTAELQTLRALGMTPTQATVTASAGPALVGVVGAVLAATGAWVVSRWFPYGTAAYYEPSPGLSWDGLVLGGGAVVVLLLVVVGAAFAARLAIGAAGREAVARRSVVASAVLSGGAPVPVQIGARFALEAGRGRTAVPVRPALLGAVTGVLGVLAAFTFSHGVNDAASHPERFGQTFQLASFLGINGQDFGPVSEVSDVLLRQDVVTGVDDARTAVATDPTGDVSISLWQYAPGPKPIKIVALDGRAPESPREVMLAPKTMSAMHAHVGQTVTLKGSTATSHDFTVSGVGFIPIGPHNGYADGGWIGGDGFTTLFGKGFKYHLLLVSLRAGSDVDKTAGALVAAVDKAMPGAAKQGLAFDKGQQPTEIAELRQVRTLPIVLGGFLALLAVAAVGHALATAVRRRSHSLAVLRAVGMTQWQCRWVVVTQASVLAVVGLAFGIPLGLALGRTVWRAVADYTPIQYVPPMAVLVLALIAPGALLLANLLAAWPGRRAARLRISNVLRAE